MPKFLIDTPSGPEIRITDQDAKHIAKVLRLIPGDEILLTDGNGRDYQANIETVSPSMVSCRITRECETLSESPLRITLCQGMLKDKKMDSLLRHVTELGIYEWQPFFCERSIPVPDKKRIVSRVQRWESIARESLKQCGRSRMPIINPPREFKDIMDQSSAFDLNIIFWEDLKSAATSFNCSRGGQSSISTVLILVGPEGGFSSREIIQAQDKNFTVCGMGPRILRAQTASIAACTLIQNMYGDM